MYRFSALCLAVLMALCLAACGSAAGPGSASATPVESAPPDASPAVPDTEPPTVTISKETRRYQSDDGQATVLSCEWNSAAVSVPGSEKAQAAIQADLDQIAGTFQKTSEEYYREAAALYQQGKHQYRGRREIQPRKQQHPPAVFRFAAYAPAAFPCRQRHTMHAKQQTRSARQYGGQPRRAAQRNGQQRPRDHRQQRHHQPGAGRG